jgi:hypothetical protein
MRGKALAATLAATIGGVVFAGVAHAGTTVQPVIQRGTTVLQNTPVDTTVHKLPVSGREFAKGGEGDADAGGPGDGPGTPDRGHHRHHGGGPLSVPNVRPSIVLPGSTVQSWDGIDGFDQRFANGGNQFSVEPPDQGLCAGNGYVVEPVNDMIAVYTESGHAQTRKEDLNTFFGYPAQFNRTTGVEGPQVTDPSCLYDPESGKFIVDVLTYEVDADGNPTGVNHLDLAVSQTSDPNGTWTLYSIPATDDGSQGTPSHPDCPCLGDYPHVGIDANGYFLTTNEYSWFSDGYNGVQLYAISKAQLTGMGLSIAAIHYDDITIAGNPSFTAWPANANPSDWDRSSRGTEYFLSSMATQEANNANGIDNRIAVWTLVNTSSLDTGRGIPLLRIKVDRTETYAIPPASDQKPASNSQLPLLSCLNDRTPLFAGPGGTMLDCSQAVAGEDDPYSPEVEGPLDSNDSRMQQVWLVHGLLLGALDTAVNVLGSEKAGIAYFTFDANSNRLVDQGYLAVAGNNVIYPAIATLSNGSGVMAFTLTGRNFYPSAAYARLRPGFVGPVQVAAQGVGPQDGFTEYREFSPTGDGVARPRWGDYGAAVVDAGSLWIASEYIGQSCTYQTWLASGFTCGGTRSALLNWDTRISQLTP